MNEALTLEQALRDLELPRELFDQCGITRLGITTTQQVCFSPEVRELCRQNVCGGYGRTWACPPGVGTLEECQKRCEGYSHVLVLTSFYPLEDSFDWEGMQTSHREFQQATRKLADLIPSQLRERSLLLANEGCGRCERCTYPDAPCRFPEKLSPSVESMGIRVDLLAQAAGLPYISGQNTVTFFGALFWNPKAE